MFSRLGSVGLVVCIAFFVSFVGGCGGGGIKIEDADQRIKVLVDNGVPDSLTAGPKVHLYQLKAAKATGSSALARRHTDSLIITLEAAEAWYQGQVEKAKPDVEVLQKTLTSKKEGLTGMHLQVADSVVAIADSLYNKAWYMQALKKAREYDILMDSLNAEEAHAADVRKRLPGRWAGQRKAEGSGLSGMETRIFTFGKDGSLNTVEKMKGQTSEFLKEDWEFISWGTWDLKGDTVFMYIEREKCPRQIFWNLKNNTWVKDVKPTYDKEITDGSKDRYVTFAYIKEFFKKI